MTDDMVPAHDGNSRPAVPPGRLAIWVRASLLLIAAGLVGVFVVAARLNPYDAEGRPMRLGSHEQLGLPACTFVARFGRPCPTCGMTTSFALLMHGDLAGSLRANCAGTLLAAWFVVLSPWAMVGALRGRWPFGRAVETWLLWGLIGIVGVAAVRWAAAVGLPWLCGFG